MKKLFLMLGMTAGIGLAICGGALLSMGNAASVPASAAEVSTYASTPSWENGEMIDGAIWKLVLCTTPDPSDENNDHARAGEHLYRCPECGLGHSYAPDLSQYLVTSFRKNSTCSYEYTHNGVRGSVLHRGNVTIHNGEEYTIEPTCTTAGETGLQCKDCGAKTVFSELPALGHDPVTIKGVEPTCTTPGKTEGSYCSRCETVFTEQELIPALGHDYSVGESVSATQMYCSDTKYSCSRCGVYYYSLTGLTSRKAHETTVISETEGTCVTQGTKRIKCTECEYSWEEKTALAAHRYPSDGIITKPATCEEDGVLTFACEVCGGAQYTERIPMLGHEIVSIPASEPTCTEKGNSAGSKCARCDKIIVEPTERPALGHAWGAWDDMRGSCDEVGTRTRTCARCSEVEVEEIPAGTHTWDLGVITQQPTCTESGVRKYTCVLCGDEQTETVAATGHNGVSIAGVSPTCTKTGLTDGSKCTLCGIVLTEQKVIPATGHDMDHVRAVEPTETMEGNIEYWRCKTCGLYFSDENGIREINADDTILDRLPSTAPDDDPDEAPDDETPAEDEGGMTWWQITLAVVAGVLLLGVVGLFIDKFVINKDGNSLYDKAVSKMNRKNDRE